MTTITFASIAYEPISSVSIAHLGGAYIVRSYRAGRCVRSITCPDHATALATARTLRNA